MTVARSLVYLLGTTETDGVDTVTPNSTEVGAEKDLLGDAASEGRMRLYLRFACTAAAGFVDVYLYPMAVTGGQTYSNDAPIVMSVARANATKYVFVGEFSVGRFMKGAVKNNYGTTNITEVSLIAEVFKES